jgi:hypothetical protein
MGCSTYLQFFGLHHESPNVYAISTAGIGLYRKLYVKFVLEGASLTYGYVSGFVQEDVLRRARFCNEQWGDV